jgi:hypothetical protein
MPSSPWDIRREGRVWHAEEAMARYQLTPEKIEMVKGRAGNLRLRQNAVALPPGQRVG